MWARNPSDPTNRLSRKGCAKKVDGNRQLRFALRITVVAAVLVSVLSPTNPAQAQSDFSCSIRQGQVTWTGTPSWATAHDVLRDGKVLKYLGPNATTWVDNSPNGGKYQIKAKTKSQQTTTTCVPETSAESTQGFRLLFPPTLTAPGNNSVLNPQARNRLSINADYVLARNAVLSWKVFPEGQPSRSVWTANTTNSNQKSVEIEAGKLAANTRYEWQVTVSQGCPFADCLTKSSQIRGFRTASPTPNPPPRPPVVPVLSAPQLWQPWNAATVDHTKKVDLKINQNYVIPPNATLSWKVFPEGRTSQTIWTTTNSQKTAAIPANKLQPNTRYQWNVTVLRGCPFNNCQTKTSATRLVKTEKPAPPPPPPVIGRPPAPTPPRDHCLSLLPLNRPQFTSSGRAQIATGNGNFSVDWTDVPCASEYDYRLLVDGVQFASGTTKESKLVHGLGPRWGRICISVTATGLRSDSLPTTHATYGCAYRSNPNPPTTTPPPTPTPPPTTTPVAIPGVYLTPKTNSDGTTFDLYMTNARGGPRGHKWVLRRDGVQIADGSEYNWDGQARVEIDIGQTFGKFCAEVKAYSGRRVDGEMVFSYSAPKTVCKTIVQRKVSDAYISLSGQAGPKLAVQITTGASGGGQYATLSARVTKAGRSIYSGPVNRAVVNKLIDLDGSGAQYCVTVTARLDGWASSSVKECVTEADLALKKSRNRSFWSIADAQIIVDGGYSNRLFGGMPFTAALFESLKAKGYRGNKLGEALNMFDSSMTWREGGAIAVGIGAYNGVVDRRHVADLGAYELQRDDLYSKLVTWQKPLEDLADVFGTNAMARFTSNMERAMTQADVQYYEYVHTMTALGYVTGHAHFTERGYSTGQFVSGGLGVVTGGQSVVLSVKNAQAAKVLGGLGLTIGTIAIGSELNAGDFGDSPQDAAELAAVLASVGALAATGIGAIILGIVAVGATLLSIFLPDGPSPPTMLSDLSHVRAYLKHHA